MNKIKIIISAILIVALFGCAKTIKLEDVPTQNLTGEAIVKAQVRNESVTKNIEEAKPHSNTIGNLYLGIATQDLMLQRKDLDTASSELYLERTSRVTERNELTAAINTLNNTIVEYDNKWYVKLGKRIESWSRWLVGLLVFSVVIRAISQGLPGPLGTLLAGMSTAILAVLTLGVSLIQAIFDNIYFLISRKKLKKAEQDAEKD